jgi:hypothetical protein
MLIIIFYILYRFGKTFKSMVSHRLLFFILLVTVMTASFAKRIHFKAFGRRRIADRLIERKIVNIRGEFLKVTQATKVFWGDKKSFITQIKITKKGAFSKKPSVNIVLGGPGYKFVSLNFKSKRSKGIHIIIDIYGRRKPTLHWKRKTTTIHPLITDKLI